MDKAFFVETILKMIRVKTLNIHIFKFLINKQTKWQQLH